MARRPGFARWAGEEAADARRGEREEAAGGILVTLAKPTKDMLREAASHGFFDYGLGKSRKITVRTIDELLPGVQDDAERLLPRERKRAEQGDPDI